MHWVEIKDEPKLTGYKWADFGEHFIVEGNDKVYTLKQLSPVSLTCNCKGFQYRGRCKHADYLQQRVKLTKVPRDWAKSYIEQIEACFIRSSFVLRVAGSYLRGRQLVKDLDFVVVTRRSDFKEAALVFCSHMFEAFKPTIVPKSGRIIRGKLDEMRVDFYLCHPDEFGAMMMFLTGPKEFNIFCRILARKKGYRLSQYGLFVGDTDERVGSGEFEGAIFELLGLDFLSPEQREKFCTN